MNAEKELLLALLIEKYTTKKPVEKALEMPIPKRVRKGRAKAHHWTEEQKAFLLQQRAKGHEFYKIAAAMGLRTKQVSNMHYSLTLREKAGK